jgi:uncharacterized protein (TIGR03437 family)
MSRVLATVALVFSFGLPAAADDAPTYSAASIVNAADNQTTTLAPNVITTIYGTGLSYVTLALRSSDMRGDELPNVLSGSGVWVLVGGLTANIYYVSPTQINFLVPASFQPTASNVQVVRDGTSGPLIPVRIAASAPALFQMDAQNAIATRPDGSLLTPAAPATPGGIVILYGTGLGQTVPAAVFGQIPREAAQVKQIAAFQIILDGIPVDATNILYAGLAPGFAGLYQINLRIPTGTGPSPEIRIGYPDALSKTGVHLSIN